MTYPRNGRTIKIPVRRIGLQLPPVEYEVRPLLEAPDASQDEVVEAKAEVEDTSKVRADAADEPQWGVDWQVELDQVRLRVERRAESRVLEEQRRLLGRMLETLDNLERALAHATGSDPLYAGVELILNESVRQLSQEGVEPFCALGQPFDPNVHEAVATDGTDGRMVIKVLQRGYTLNGDLLRPARVVVGSGED